MSPGIIAKHIATRTHRRNLGVALIPHLSTNGQTDCDGNHVTPLRNAGPFHHTQDQPDVKRKTALQSCAATAPSACQGRTPAKLVEASPGPARQELRQSNRATLLLHVNRVPEGHRCGATALRARNLDISILRRVRRAWWMVTAPRPRPTTIGVLLSPTADGTRCLASLTPGACVFAAM